MEGIVSSSHTGESSAAQSSCVSVGVGVSTVCESSAAIAVDVWAIAVLIVYLCLLEETMNEASVLTLG